MMNLGRKIKNKQQTEDKMKKDNFDFENSSIRPMAITVKIVVLNSDQKVLLLKRSKKV